MYPEGSTSLVIRELRIKTTIRYCFTANRLAGHESSDNAKPLSQMLSATDTVSTCPCPLASSRIQLWQDKSSRISAGLRPSMGVAYSDVLEIQMLSQIDLGLNPAQLPDNFISLSKFLASLSFTFLICKMHEQLHNMKTNGLISTSAEHRPICCMLNKC